MSQKKYFFEKCFWLRFNNTGLALGMTLKMYASVAKGLKLKFRTFLGLMQMLNNNNKKTGRGKGAF